MVLGYDDLYLPNKSVVAEITPFEKYYQRIVKRTDNQYFYWIKDMHSKENEVYVYGHSFTPSDGDVLREFLCEPTTKTLIYCKDEEDRAKIINNLAQILGPRKLIEIASGTKPCVEFKVLSDE